MVVFSFQKSEDNKLKIYPPFLKKGQIQVEFEYSMLLLNKNTFPKGDKVFDLLSCRFWIWIIPGCVFVNVLFDHHIIIASNTFPWACRMSITFFQELSIYGIWWKIIIAFNYLKFIALCDNLSFPDCFHQKINSN